MLVIAVSNNFDVLMEMRPLVPRDVDGAYGPELNRLRRKRRFKYSARERLFNFLRYCRQYQSLQRTADKHCCSCGW